MLTIQNIYKSYKKENVLNNINIDMDNGIYALLAPNGAGKTTLMKIIATLLTPDKGQIFYEEKDIWKLGKEYHNILGYLPQKVGYYSNYTPLQFLKYLAVLKDIDAKLAKQRIDKLLILLNLENVANKKIGKFSGGMIQRIGIAGALINSPKILLLDEPSVGLDPQERMRLKNIFSELSKDKLLLISTHITSDIDFIANEIIMIKNNTIFQKSTIENLCTLFNNHIFETTIIDTAYEDFYRQYYIISEQRKEEYIHIRFYNLSKEQEEWTVCNPTLEDIFLHTYEEKKPMLRRIIL